jgi:hypothetical protein
MLKQGYTMAVIESDSLIKCVVVSLDENEMVSVRRCVPMGGGGEMILPAEVDKYLIAQSLKGKVDQRTIAWLCHVWDGVLVHLKTYGGEAFVHEDRVDVSAPEKRVFLSAAARSAVV